MSKKKQATGHKKRTKYGHVRARRGASGVLLGFITVLLALFIQTSFILLLIGMLPTIVATFIETDRVKNHVLIISCCNLSGVLPYVAQLVAQNNSHGALIRMMQDPSVWAMMYGSAILGWLLVWGSPYIVEFIIDFSNRSKVIRLRMLQTALVKQWGQHVAGDLATASTEADKKATSADAESAQQ